LTLASIISAGNEPNDLASMMEQFSGRACQQGFFHCADCIKKKPTHYSGGSLRVSHGINIHMSCVPTDDDGRARKRGNDVNPHG
jgi:hypothetical protein